METTKPLNTRVKRRNSIKAIQERNIFHAAKSGKFMEKLPPAAPQNASEGFFSTPRLPLDPLMPGSHAAARPPRKGSKMGKYVADSDVEPKRESVNTALNNILADHISAPVPPGPFSQFGAATAPQSARGSLESNPKGFSTIGRNSGGSIVEAKLIGEAKVLSSGPDPQVQKRDSVPDDVQSGTSRDWDLCRPLQARGRTETRAKDCAENYVPVKKCVTPESGIVGSGTKHSIAVSRKAPRPVSPESGFVGAGVPLEKATQNMPTKPQALLSQTKQRPTCKLSGDFEFKPSSRSSSENSQPNTPQHQESARRGNAASGKDAIVKKGRFGRATTQGEENSRTSSIVSSRSASSTTYVNFDSFDLQIENGRAPSKILGWEDLPIDGESTGSSVRQCIEWYGWTQPTKFQAVAIPSICQACQNVQAKSYTLLQAQKSLGKTSALVLSLLASVKPIPQLQFVVVALDACSEIDAYLSSLGVLCPVQVACLDNSDDGEGNLERDVAKLSRAQILVGPPERVSAALARAQASVDFEHVQALVIDDASEIISGKWVESVCGVNQLLSCGARSQLRYVVLSNFIANEAKPALRALKSSLMSKKNMFDLSVQVGRVKKFVKHYAVPGDNWQEWLPMLLELQKLIFIPRAVIFCDDETKFSFFRKQIDGWSSAASRNRGIHVATNFNVAIMDPTEDLAKRREALNLFMSGKKDFLLTKTEPNVFQMSMPRVFWVINFGVEEKNLAWYGCRLLCLDETLRGKAQKKGPHQDGVSILFQEKTSSDEQTTGKLQKMFQVKFESLPFGDLGGIVRENIDKYALPDISPRSPLSPSLQRSSKRHRQPLPLRAR
jgi:superfamily II DNA/RNA helicase